jgi:hypothetical protein
MMTISKRYAKANELVIFIEYSPKRAQFRLSNAIASVCAILNDMRPQDAMAISSLIISYFIDHQPRVAHEFIDYLAKEN